ncbi:MAG: hypothetical protein WCS89_02290 [Candidatus Paceibacterota bacterium]|jgi:Ni,Fe-hydrogenase maturation factor
MKIKTVFIFGNPDLEMDSLPIRLVPRLQKIFPEVSFQIKDPNEEWDIPEEMTIIDTAVGVDEVTIFDDLESFDKTPQLSMHDFDALTNLRYMKKLGRLKKIMIIGVPPDISEEKAVEEIKKILLK